MPRSRRCNGVASRNPPSGARRAKPPQACYLLRRSWPPRPRETARRFPRRAVLACASEGRLCAGGLGGLVAQRVGELAEAGETLREERLLGLARLAALLHERLDRLARIGGGAVQLIDVLAAESQRFVLVLHQQPHERLKALGREPRHAGIGELL